MAAFEELNALNVNEHTETKNVSGTKLTYLSWPWAWAEIKKRYPDAHYDIWKNENNLPFAYDPATGYMVYTSVTIEGITHEMWLPVMDGANKAMRAQPYKYTTKWGEKTVEAASMMDINKTIMRCLVKNLAMFGLGLYIYAGEDLPQVETPEPEKVPDKPVDKKTGPEKGTVEQSKTLPPNPEPAEGEKPGVFLQRRITEMKAEFENFDFLKIRKALIEGGVVPDIPSATMTMEQAKNLADAVYKTCAQKVPA